MKRYFTQLSSRLRRLFSRRRKRVDADADPSQYFGIHSQDKDGNIMHILVKRRIQSTPPISQGARRL